MYISHFIQVLYLTSERGEINGGIKYYELKDYEGKVPPLNTEEEILFWGNKIVAGEQKRIQNGGSAIYNPSIALVKIKIEEFNDAAIFQNNLRKNTSRSFDKMRDIRKFTNEFIGKMWSAIEENIISDDAKIKRQISQEYGLVYIFRRNEKTKLKENPKELQKALQRDLVFDFGQPDFNKQSLQENAKYCVILVLKTVIYKSKLLEFQDFESLVFDVFLSKTEKTGSFLADTKQNYKAEIVFTSS